MTARNSRIAFVLLIAAVFALLCWHFPVQVDRTVEAMEYRYDDPGYAVPHTITIQGIYRNSALLNDTFEGTFAISGEPKTDNSTVDVTFRRGEWSWPSYTRPGNMGLPHFTPVFDLRTTPDFSSFRFHLMEVTTSETSTTGTWDITNGRFVAWPAANRDEAMALDQTLINR